MSTSTTGKRTNFIDKDKLYNMLEGSAPTESRLDEILNKSMLYKGLTLEEVAELLKVESPEQIAKIMEAARHIKEKIYGKRLVIFAPLYIGNQCSNECLYCGFRKGNKALKRANLTMPQIEQEVTSILKTGHKRLLMLMGESEETPFEYFIEALKTAYGVRAAGEYVRRINIEIAPLEVDQFKQLKDVGIGTYACFQETYDPELYKKYHRAGPKADYEKRLFVMHDAMEAGIDDVGIGALFGLADYRFEVLAMHEHAFHLDKHMGCAPHTVSIPRLEPADNAPYSEKVPYPVSDENFKKLVAIIRISMPWTGLILTTREKEDLRTELFNHGVSQISAGSKTNPGAYADGDSGHDSKTGAQFSLGDHRNLEQVIEKLIEDEYIPSFCTACYRMGRVGADFMDLAKPGLIKDFCDPNGVITFVEYLHDHASPEMRKKGFALAEKLIKGIEKDKVRNRAIEKLDKLKDGERDLYF